MGDARTQSPPTKNCAPESPTFGEIAGFNRTKCNARSPPGGTALLITVPAVPGKLTSLPRIKSFTVQAMQNTCGFRVVNLNHLRVIIAHARVALTTPVPKFMI